VFGLKKDGGVELIIFFGQLGVLDQEVKSLLTLDYARGQLVLDLGNELFEELNRRNEIVGGFDAELETAADFLIIFIYSAVQLPITL